MFTKRRAFSLVELLIALTIFTTVAVLCVTALVNSMASARRIQAQVFLYSEAQALMDMLAREVERNTIDYEAYYLRYGYYNPDTGWDTANYGFYGQSFYDPDSDDPSLLEGPYDGITGYKVDCSDGSGYYPESCPDEVPNYDYLDLDTGAHPFTGIDSFIGYSDDPTYMNAFCESADGSTDCEDWQYNVLQELILINGAGDERTIFVLEETDVSGEYRLAKAKLSGTDSDYDGIVDSWTCTDEYSSCGGTNSTPDPTDLTNGDDDADFMPVMPSKLTLERFYVMLAPVDDPYRAFAEEDVQVQPHVTIVFTLTLNDAYASRVLGETPQITLQRTISSGVYSEVVSYE